jgi:phenylalanyl-tRNA synthetase beta chain
MLPNLMENLRSNKHRKFPQRIFEITDCVIPDRSETSASNMRKLSGAISHSQASLSEVISILNAVKESFGAKWEMKPHKHESFIPGRCGAVFLPGKQEPLGIFGEISPKVLGNFELNNPAAAFELDVQKIFGI